MNSSHRGKQVAPYLALMVVGLCVAMLGVDENRHAEGTTHAVAWVAYGLGITLMLGSIAGMTVHVKKR